MQATGATPLPEWDYEWSWEDGTLSSNGWTKTSNGTTAENVQAEQERLRIGASGVGSYLKLDYPNGNRATAVLQVHHSTTGSSGWYFVISLGNGTGGVAVRFQYTTSYKGIYLCNYESPFIPADVGGMTKLTALASGSEHITKLVLNGNYADIYDNNVLLISNVSIASILGITSTGFYFEQRGNGYNYSYLKDIKMKLGRIA